MNIYTIKNANEIIISTTDLKELKKVLIWAVSEHLNRLEEVGAIKEEYIQETIKNIMTSLDVNKIWDFRVKVNSIVSTYGIGEFTAIDLDAVLNMSNELIEHANKREELYENNSEEALTQDMECLNLSFDLADAASVLVELIKTRGY